MLERIKKLLKGGTKEQGERNDQPTKSSFDDVLKNREEADKKKNIKKHREQCIELAMKEMGWTRKQAVDDLNEMKERLGIKYTEYRRYHFFEIPKEKQAERLKEIRDFKELRSNTQSDGNKEHIAEIAEITGRPEATVRSDLKRGRDKLKSILKEADDFE